MQRVPYWRLSAFYFSYYAFLGVFTPYFTLYLQSLAFSAWEIGLLMSQMQLMRLIGPYLWGGLADRLGQRLPIVRVSGLVALVLFLGFFFVTRFAGLLSVMAVLAFFWAASLPLVEALTFDHLREKAAHYGRIRLWGSVGFIVAVMGGGALLDHLPLFAVLWLSLAMLLAIVLCSQALTEAEPLRSHVVSPPVSEILRQPRIRALLAASFAMAAANSILNTFYAIYLADHGYSKSLVGVLYSLGVVAEIVAFLFMPRVMRRFSLRAILMTSFSVAIVRYMMIGWGVDSIPVLVATQMMHAVTFGAFHAAAISAINRWFPGRARSRGQALYASVSVGAGGWLGGILCGWSWDTLGDRLTFASGSLYSLVGLILVALWIRERPVGETRSAAL